MSPSELNTLLCSIWNDDILECCEWKLGFNISTSYSPKLAIHHRKYILDPIPLCETVLYKLLVNVSILLVDYAQMPNCALSSPSQSGGPVPRFPTMGLGSALELQREAPWQNFPMNQWKKEGIVGKVGMPPCQPLIQAFVLSGPTSQAQCIHVTFTEGQSRQGILMFYKRLKSGEYIGNSSVGSVVDKVLCFLF